MWRTELWHPLVVHFPIALLLVGTGMRMIAMLHRRYAVLRFLVPAGRTLLGLGTLGAWVAVYTGTLADAEVARTLCDPTIAETHEQWAYRTAWLFTGGLGIDVLLWRGWTPNLGRLGRFGVRLVLVGLLLSGSAGLGYVGHLGAQLVYQQAAAVYHPGPDCAAFE